MNSYKIFLRPFLFQLYPENAHQLSLQALKFASKVPFAYDLLEKIYSYQSSRLEQIVAGIRFKNPVGLAAGFDKTGELYPYFSRLGFGFIETGTITGMSQPGNPKPRVFRYPGAKAMVNRMGFNNPGSNEVFNLLNKQRKLAVRGINAGKTKFVPLEDAVEDYLQTFNLLDKFADYFVINISSPNTPGLRDLQNTKNFINLLDGIQKGLRQNQIPIFVKFSPDLADNEIPELLDICLEKKIAGVILTNTTLDKTTLPAAIHQNGGLSGQPLQMRSTDMIKIAYRHLQGRIPIIGVGGIDSGASALAKIRAGANLIQIYTGYIYEGPSLPKKILNYLDLFMVKNDIKNISEIVGN